MDKKEIRKYIKDRKSALSREYIEAYSARLAEKAADHFGWVRVPFKKNGVERTVDEKNEEIYRLILEAIKE